jgi:hypothetical protein
MERTPHESIHPPRVPSARFRERFRLQYPLLSLRLDELGMEYRTFFTTSESASVLRVSGRSVQRYAEHEDLRVTAIGHLRCHAEELERLLREGLPRRRRRRAGHLELRHNSSDTSVVRHNHGAI